MVFKMGFLLYFWDINIYMLMFLCFIIWGSMELKCLMVILLISLFCCFILRMLFVYVFVDRDNIVKFKFIVSNFFINVFCLLLLK